MSTIANDIPMSILAACSVPVRHIDTTQGMHPAAIASIKILAIVPCE
ncbi:hypothetical protein [Arthrobacter castelli]|nr:hypothetical protein [Arthrobacter castelli]